MQLVADKDVQKVLEFMQSNIECRRLVSVAESVSRLASVLWKHYEADDVVPLELKSEPI